MKEDLLNKIGEKKFLYVLPNLEIGGAELQTINQLNYFQENGINNFGLVILSNKIDEKCSKALLLSSYKRFELGIDGMEVISSKSLIKSFKASKELSAVIRKTNTNVVIAVLLTSQFIARLTKLYHFFTFKPTFKIVSYYRGIDYQLFLKKNGFLKLFNIVNRTIAFFTDNKSIFISKAVKEDNVNNFYINKNNIVIHNSLPEKISDDIIGEQILEKLKIDRKTFTIVVPGIVHAASKGQFFFVESFKTFVTQKKLMPSDIEVIIAGDGSDFEGLKKLVEKNELEEYVTLYGYMQNKDLLSLFKAINLVVVPSISEGFGNVVIEALMQQALVLASDTGGIPEIITHEKNGLLFKSNNIDSLVEKLSYVYDNRAKEIIKKAEMIKSYKSNFTLESQIEKIINFLAS
jgi:glycosyltransferase involved in cell wall biosynthesis